MIRFRPQTLLVYDPDTQTENPLDQEALQARLEQAFAQAGTTDHILLNTLMETLLRHFDQQEAPPTRTTKDDLSRLISQVLQDLGQPKVASCFAQLDKVPAAIIGNSQQITDSKLVPALLQTTRYIASTEWNLPLSPELLQLIQKRVLSLRPLSDLQRMVTVDCRPSRLYDLPVSPRTELELHLLLPQLAQQTAQVLKMMRNAVQNRWGTSPDNVAQIHVLEIHALVQVSCPSRSTKIRQSFAEQLQTELETALRQATEFPLLIDFSE